MDILENFTPADYWKAIILYGLNSTTYKMALAKCLLGFANDRKTTISRDELAKSFYWQYKQRLSTNTLPQPTSMSTVNKRSSQACQPYRRTFKGDLFIFSILTSHPNLPAPPRLKKERDPTAHPGAIIGVLFSKMQTQQCFISQDTFMEPDDVHEEDHKANP